MSFCLLVFLPAIECFDFFRELRDSRQRYDALVMDLKRKEKQIKDLQNRLDSGDGCKYNFMYI